MSWFKKKEAVKPSEEDLRMQAATQELAKFVPGIRGGMLAQEFWLEFVKSATGLFTELHKLKDEYEALVREAKK